MRPLSWEALSTFATQSGQVGAQSAFALLFVFSVYAAVASLVARRGRVSHLMLLADGLVLLSRGTRFIWEWALLALSGLFLGLHFATWIGSLGMTSVASSVVLVSTGPVFVALGSWLLLRERVAARTLAGVAVAAAGSVLIGWADLGRGQSRLVGDLLALAGAVLVAGYLMIGRRVRARRSLGLYIALVYGGAMVTLLLIVLVAGEP